MELLQPKKREEEEGGLALASSAHRSGAKARWRKGIANCEDLCQALLSSVPLLSPAKSVAGSTVVVGYRQLLYSSPRPPPFGLMGRKNGEERRRGRERYELLALAGS